MTRSDTHEAPVELVDALARIDQAKQNWFHLRRELHDFLYEYVKGMVKGRDRATGNFVLRLRHPKESVIRGTPKVLVGQIVENLRTALDYLVFELSVKNVPELNERVPQFVIAEDESDFRRQAKRRLRYLTDEQRGFVGQIQPYTGNQMLALLGEMAGKGKHRRLLSLRDRTGMQIYFAEMSKEGEFDDCFVYPVEKDHAFFARPTGDPAFLLMDEFDAIPILKEMIGHVEDVVRVAYCFFEGTPLRLTIVR